MLALVALSLALTPIVYVLPESKIFPQGTLVVTGIPKAKVPKLGIVREPALSPDKTRVLFWADAKGSYQNAPVKELDLRTGKVRTVVNGNCRSPGWSPDGKWIFFTRYGNGWHLFIQPAKGGKASVILGLATKTDVFSPVWSAGNASIVAQDMAHVTWVFPGGTRERTVSVPEILTDPGLITSSETFTDRPGDPNTLAFSQEAPGAKVLRDEMTELVGAIFLYDLKSKQRRRLTSESFSVRNPRWSADGEWLYFEGQRATRTGSKTKIEQGIWRMRPDEKVAELVAPGGTEFSL